MEAGLREGEPVQRPAGRDAPGLPHGETLPEDLAAQVRVFQDECEREVAALRQFHTDALARFVAGYQQYGSTSIQYGDLDEEARRERLDEFNYRMMQKMRERGL